MSINTYTILDSEQYQDSIEVIFYHGRSDYKAHIRLAKIDGVDGGVSIDDLTTTPSGASGVAFIPPSVLIEALEMLGCAVPEDSYFRACHKASGHTHNTCRDNMCDNCPQREKTQELPDTLFAAHRRIAQLQRDYDKLADQQETKATHGELVDSFIEAGGVGAEAAVHLIVQRLEELAAECAEDSATLMTYSMDADVIEVAVESATNAKLLRNLAFVLFDKKYEIIDGTLMDLGLDVGGDILKEEDNVS